MVSQISFGQLNTIGGKQVLSGSQSGIDTNALITALTTAKAAPATADQTTITANQAKITALTTLKTDLQTLQTSLDALRNPTIDSSADNTFGDRSPFLTISNGGTPSNYIGVTTGNGAPIGNYLLQVDHLATAETDQSVSFPSSSASIVNASGTNTAGQFAAGTFKINGASITLGQGASLSDVAAAINAQSGNSNVTASIVQLSSSNFVLQLTGNNTGASNAITITDPSGVLPSTSGHQTMFSVTQAAQNSQIEFGTSAGNLQTVTRPSNQISDLLSGVTLSLYAPTAGATVSLAIDKNNNSIATAVSNFTTAYNAIRTFEAQQTAVDSTGALLPTSVLANDSTMNSVVNQLAALISGQASIAIPSQYQSGNVTAPVRMGDVGISLDSIPKGTDSSGNATPAVSNTLTLDPTALSTNLESFFNNVSNIFQFNFTASSSNLGIYQRDNTVTNSTMQVAIDTSQPVGSQAKVVNIDGSGLVSSIPLNFQTTTVLQGASMLNTGGVVNAAGTNNAGFFAAGTFQINGVNVTLNQNDTLSDVANEINAANTGVTASIVSNSNTDYRLVLTGTANGTNGITFTDPSGVLPTPSMFTTQSSTSIVSGKSGTDLSALNFVYSGSGNETVTETNALTSKDFTLSVDTSQPAGSQAEITKIYGATLSTPIAMTYTASGGSALISGVAGTAFSGLQMVYTGSGSQSIDVSMSQGIADKMYNAVTNILNGNGGTGSVGMVDEEINNLTTTDNNLQTQITTINNQVSTYRTQLLNTYAQLEAAISSANSLLSLLSAQDNAALVNSGH